MDTWLVVLLSLVGLVVGVVLTLCVNYIKGNIASRKALEILDSRSSRASSLF